MSSCDDPFTVLGVRREASLDEVKRAYRRLAMQWHPDKVASKGVSAEALRHAKEKFQQINEAYEKIIQVRTN